MKDFFKQKWVRITSALLVVLGAIGLILGGSSAEDVNQIVKAVEIAIISIGGVIALISAIVSPKSKE